VKLSELVSAVRHICPIVNYRPACATCDRPVERIADEPLPMPDQTVRVVFMCHGKTEAVRLHPENGLKDWPKRLFLRNWAGCTIKPERAKWRRL
jgi:hypothetical protein